MLQTAKAVTGQAVVTYHVDRMRRQLPWMSGPWAKAAGVPGMFSEALAVSFATIIRDRLPMTVLEVGSYLGRSAVFMAECLRVLGLHRSVVHCVDPHTGDRQQLSQLGAADGVMTNQAALFHDHLRIAGVRERVRTHVATSTSVAAAWDGAMLDLLYIDGWHSFEAVLEDGRAWMPFVADGGVVIFDDYARYEDVRRGVNQLVTERRLAIWGGVFGQAVGGPVGSAPTGAIARLIRQANGPLLRYVFRPREL